MTSRDEQARLAKLLDLAIQLDPAIQQGAEELDPNDVAQLAAGRPGKKARSVLEARLAQAPPGDRRIVVELAAELVDGVAADTAAGAGSRRGQRTSALSWRPIGLAALVLMAIGVGWALLQSAGAPPGGDPLHSDAVFGDATLRTAFAALRGVAPDAFEGIDPLLAGERESAPAPIRRGGMRVLAPAGALVAPSGSLRWQAVPGASAYAVRVLSDEGDEVLHLTHDGTSLPWPPEVVLKQGTAYVVAVSTVAAGIRRRGSSAFRVLSQQELARFEAGLDAIARVDPVPLRPVLRAHLAIRWGLFGEARRYLERARDGTRDGMRDGLRDDARADMLLDQTRSFLDRVQGRE